MLAYLERLNKPKKARYQQKLSREQKTYLLMKKEYKD